MRHPAVPEGGQQRSSGEPRLVQHQDRRPRVPRRVHVAPGVLGPPRGGQVQVHVARLDADPVHGGQVPHRVAGLGVRDQLGLGRGPGGEVQQQRVPGPGDPVRHKRDRPRERVRVRVPRQSRTVDHDPRPVPGQPGELGRRNRVGDDVPDIAPHETVGQVGGLQQRRGRDDHRAELHRGQDDLPQRRHVAEHEQHPVAAPDPEPAQPVRDLRRTRRQRAVRQAHVGPVVGDDPQPGPVRVLGGDHVEPVQRPVELVQVRPGELASARIRSRSGGPAAGPAPPGSHRWQIRSCEYRGSSPPPTGDQCSRGPARRAAGTGDLSGRVPAEQTSGRRCRRTARRFRCGPSGGPRGGYGRRS